MLTTIRTKKILTLTMAMPSLTIPIPTPGINIPITITILVTSLKRVESAATLGLNWEYAFKGFVRTVAWEEKRWQGL